MNLIEKGIRRVVNRIVNRPSQVQKRRYLQLRSQLEPCRAPEAERIDNEKPVLIISGLTMTNTGIFCDMLAFLRWVRFAQILDYTPVIDMKNVPNMYLEADEVGRVNAYDYFYNQPGAMSLDEAYRCKNVYFVNRLDCPYDFTRRQKRAYREATRVVDWVYGENRAKYFQTWKAVYDAGFTMSETARAYVEEQYRRVIADRLEAGTDGSVLGLLCRGTDYVNRRPYGHQIQPTIEQIREKVDEYIQQHRTALIFVATEDAGVLRALHAAYGEMLTYIECPRCETRDESIAQAFAEQHVNRRLNGLNYFASIALLSRCDAVIAEAFESLTDYYAKEIAQQKREAYTAGYEDAKKGVQPKRTTKVVTKPCLLYTSRCV